jgi:hypothetical protein
MLAMRLNQRRADDVKVRERAYQLWEAEGRPDGRHEEHWYQAERELARRIPTVKEEFAEVAEAHDR